MYSDSNGFGCSDCWSWGQYTFPRISSSGSFFIAMMFSSHRVFNDCTTSCFSSTVKIWLKSRTDSSVSLTLNARRLLLNVSRTNGHLLNWFEVRRTSFVFRRRTVKKIEFFARARACWNVFGFWSCSLPDLLRVFAQFQMYWNLLCFWWCSFCVEFPMFLFVSLLFQSLFSLPSLPVLFMSVRIFTVSRALFLHALWMCVVEGRGTQGGVVWVRCDVFFWFYDYFQRFELFFAAIHARSRVEMRLYLHHGLCVISSRPPCLVILHVRSELAWRNGQGGSSKVEEEREKRWSGGRESGKTQPLRSKTPSSEKSKMQLLRSWTKIKKCFLSLEMRKTLLLRNKKRPLIIVWKDRFTC